MTSNRKLLREFVQMGQEIMNWDRREAYGADWSRVAPSPAIGLASPGFLGEEYADVVILAQNPGLGKGRDDAHREWDRLLNAWRDGGTIRAYRDAFEFYLEDFQQVAAWRNWVAPILDAAAISARSVAYLNLGKSVLRDNQTPKPQDPIFRADWHWTRAQLEMLEPIVVVAGGKAVADLLKDFWPNRPFQVIVQNRARSQNMATRVARAREIGTLIKRELAARR